MRVIFCLGTNDLTSVERKAHFGAEDVKPSLLTRLDPNDMGNYDLQIHGVCLAPEPPFFLFGSTVPGVPVRKCKARTRTASKRRCTTINFTGLPHPSAKHAESIRTRREDAAPRTGKEFLPSARDAFPFSTTGEPNEAVGEEEELPYALESVADLEEGAAPDEGAAGFDECKWEI